MTNSRSGLATWTATGPASRRQPRPAVLAPSAKNGGFLHRADRVTKDPVYVKTTAVHVLGGIQPDVIRKLAPDWGGSGVMQRFLLVNMGKASIAPDFEPDALARQAMADAVRRINNLLPSEFFDTFQV